MFIQDILFLAVLVTAESLSCLVGPGCPPDRPYCTPVGCVFICPENVFVKRKNCVQDCGEDFIQNRTCVPECPANQKYVREEIVSIDYRFYKHKICEKTCPKGTFISNNFCVDACPLDAPFLLNDTCVSQCPEFLPFRKNATKDETFVAFECLKSCPKDVPVSYGNICTAFCEKPLVQYQSQCMDSCPNTTSVVYYIHVTNVTVAVCANRCPVGENDFNGTCLGHCPPGYLTYNRSCMATCPKDASYTYQPTGSEDIYCEKRCPKYYDLSNTSCVDFCPLIDDKICVVHCPASAPFRCDPTVCDFVFGIDHKEPDYCVEQCGKGLYVRNATCVNYCPLVYNKTCVDVCPATSQFICDPGKIEDCKAPSLRHNKEPSYCRETCPEATFSKNNSCVQFCPLVYQKTCVDVCPVTAPYLCNRDKEFFCDEANSYFYGRRPNYCVDVCPEHTHAAVNACIASCPNDLLFFNQTCVKDCPIESKYTSVTTFKRGQWDPTYTFKECVANCSETLYLDNMTCVEQCSDDKYLVEDKRLCVETCPKSQPYIQYPLLQYPQKCVSKCDGDKVPVDGTCQDDDKERCSSWINGVCVTDCPVGSRWIFEGCRTVMNLIGYSILLLFLSLAWVMLLLLIFTNVWETWFHRCARRNKKRHKHGDDEELLLPDSDNENENEAAELVI